MENNDNLNNVRDYFSNTLKQHGATPKRCGLE